MSTVSGAGTEANEEVHRGYRAVSGAAGRDPLVVGREVFVVSGQSVYCLADAPD